MAIVRRPEMRLKLAYPGEAMNLPALNPDAPREVAWWCSGAGSGRRPDNRKRQGRRLPALAFTVKKQRNQ